MSDKFTIQPIRDIRDANKALKSIQDRLNRNDDEVREQIRIFSEGIDQAEKVTYSAFGGGVIEVPTDSEGGNQSYTNSFITNTVKRNDIRIPYDSVLASNSFTVQEVSVDAGITYTKTQNSEGDLVITVTGLTVDSGFITLDVKVLENIQDIRFVFKVVKVRATKRYYIEQNGSILKNGSGTITLQAKFDDGILNQNLSSGDIKLVDENAVNYGYSASITSADFSGAKTLRVDLKDTVLGNVYEALTLAIVDDGADGSNGISSRLDIAWGDNSDGSGNTAFPSGLLGDVTYAKATKVASNNYQGTRLVTWDSGGTEPAVSTTIGDYEWTRSTSTLNRIDLAYSDSDNGVGNLQLPTGKYSTTYIPATPLSSNYYIGTNVVSWNADETEPAVSATVGDYEWGKFRGDDGADGADGADGSDGADATSLYAVSIQYDTRISSSVPSSAGEWALKDASAYDAVGQDLANIDNFQLYKDDALDARFAHYFNYLANLPYGTALYLQLQQSSNIANYRVTLVSYSSNYINLSVNYLSSTTDFNTATEFLPYTLNTVYFNFSIGFQPMTDVDHQIGAKDSDGDTILGNITDNLVNLDHNGENPTYTNSYLDVIYIDELGTSYQYASSITSTSYDKYTLKNLTATNLTNTPSTVSNLRRFTVSNYTYNDKIGYSFISAELWVYRNGAERFAGYINHRYRTVNDAFPSGKMTTTSGTVTNKSLSYETWSFGSEVYSTGIAVCDPVTDNDIDIGAKSKNVDVIVIIDLTVSPADESFNFRLMNNGSQVGDTITGVLSTKKTVVFSGVDVTTNHLFSLVYASNDNANQDITAIQEVSIEVIHRN